MSDVQYRSFRKGLSSLIALATSFIVLKGIYGIWARPWRSLTDSTKLYQVPYLITFSSIMLFALHGTSALKVFFIISVNYAIAKSTGAAKANPIITWVFNALVLFAIERHSGFRYASIHPVLASLVRGYSGYMC